MPKEQSHTQRIIRKNGFTVVLIGTAHVSQQSADEVAATIKDHQPHCVCVELDANRLKALSGGDRWRDLDIRKIIKRKEGALLFTSILLANFQRRIGKKFNVEPGLEMKTATTIAREQDIPIMVCDRDIRTTLLRVWRLSTLWNKLRLFNMLVLSMFEKQSISEQEIEGLKQEDVLNAMLGEFAAHFPLFKQVILDERDRYLSLKVYQALRKHKSAVVVIGAGHLQKVYAHLDKMLSSDQQQIDYRSEEGELDRVPPVSVFSRAVKICIPILIGALIISGFFFGGYERGLQNITYWVLVNGIAAAVGSLLAFAHPITTISSFLLAPVTSLNPTIGIGFVAALVELFLRKPRAVDLQNISRDSQTFVGFYRNRLTKTLLIFILSSIGSAIGTFVALPLLLRG